MNAMTEIERTHSYFILKQKSNMFGRRYYSKHVLTIKPFDIKDSFEQTWQLNILDIEDNNYVRREDNFFLLRSVDYVVAGIDESVP